MPSCRKRVLIVNAYFDDARQPTRRPTTVLKAMGPVYLAAGFDAEHCEVRLWDEQSSGPLEDRRLLGWPDMLVLTGMTSAFDRMLHLTAYARTANERVIVVAGGPAVRALPRFAARFFDYPCTGEVEQIADVIEEAFSPAHADRRFEPRYDLAYWIRATGHVESTRNCNFACSFCTLTAERRGYQKYSLDRLETQIRALGRRRFLVFIDNNFYGNDREHFLARLELIRRLYREGCFRGWGALVTSDFFAKPDNLALVRQAGCQALFCGIESFDADSTERFAKRQNARSSPVSLIESCLEAGILLIYGMIADVTTRSLTDISRELDFVTRCPTITLPSFIALPIPYPGTPFFRELLESGRLLPGTRLRDLDGSTLSVRPVDEIEDVASFVRDLQTLRGRRGAVLAHAARFLRRYAGSLTRQQLAVTILRDLALLGAPSLVRAGSTPLGALLGRRRPRRTHVSTTEPLDAAYRPVFPVSRRYEQHFRPTRLIDEEGGLDDALAEDLFAYQELR